MSYVLYTDTLYIYPAYRVTATCTFKLFNFLISFKTIR